MTGIPFASVSRRAFFSLAGVVVTAVALPKKGRGQDGAAGASASPSPVVLEARQGEALLRGDRQPGTPIWGYGGALPGPTLRAKRGEELQVRLSNKLSEPTLLHWRGVRTPEGVDGVPFLTGEPLAPGASADLRFTVPDAGTYWYHAHPIFPAQRERGLYGALIVDETEPVGTDKDVLVLIDDWRLKPDGALAGAGEPGAEHTVTNGMPSLDVQVRTNERIRLRLVNASRTRLLGVRLEGHRPIVMAIDGQPAEPFPARDGRVALAPGNRVDLFAEATQQPGAVASILLDTGGPTTPIARLVYGPEPPLRPAPLPPPKALPGNGLPERMDLAKALRLSVPLGGGTKPSAAGRPETAPRSLPMSASDWRDPAAVRKLSPLFTVARGRPVVLAIANGTAAVQVFDLHNQPFRLLDALDDGWKPFWLNTFPVQPGQTMRIAFVPERAGKRMLQIQPLGQPEGAAFFWYAVT